MRYLRRDREVAATDDLRAAIKNLYQAFGRYGRPDAVDVCTTCSVEADAQVLRFKDLVTWTSAEIEATHVLAQSDDRLRHFLPRIFELLILEPCPEFELAIDQLAGRPAKWPVMETQAIASVLDAAWNCLMSSFPAEGLGYLSSAVAITETASMLGFPALKYLDGWERQHDLPAGLHLAQFVSDALSNRVDYTGVELEALTDWLAAPSVGHRLELGFFSAPDDETSQLFADSHKIWQSCTTPPRHSVVR